MSDFYNKYPYTDFHELNLDWIIERVKQLTADWLETKRAWENTEADWQELYDYVHDYFDNLNVQDEINNKINAMIADGTFVTITTPVIEAKVASMMPGTVASQIGDTVAAQIDGVVANQIDASVAGQIATPAAAAAAAWLAEHVTQPTVPAIDTSLSITGAGADAKKVGDLIGIYSNSSTYVNDELVIYNGNIYRNIMPITTAESWTASKWQQVDINDLITELRNKIDIVNNEANQVASGADNYWVYFPVSVGTKIKVTNGASNIAAVAVTDAYYGNPLETLGNVNANNSAEFTCSVAGNYIRFWATGATTVKIENAESYIPEIIKLIDQSHLPNTGASVASNIATNATNITANANNIADLTQKLIDTNISQYDSYNRVSISSAKDYFKVAAQNDGKALTEISPIIISASNTITSIQRYKHYDVSEIGTGKALAVGKMTVALYGHTQPSEAVWNAILLKSADYNGQTISGVSADYKVQFNGSTIQILDANGTLKWQSGYGKIIYLDIPMEVVAYWGPEININNAIPAGASEYINVNVSTPELYYMANNDIIYVKGATGLTYDRFYNILGTSTVDRCKIISGKFDDAVLVPDYVGFISVYDVRNSQTAYISGYVFNNHDYYDLMDDDFVITDHLVNHSGSYVFLAKYKIDVSDASYLCVSNNNDSTTVVIEGCVNNSQESAYVVDKTNSEWNDKNVVWLGTSIPASGGYNNETNTASYPIKLARELRFNCTNKSIGGSCVHCKSPDRISADNPYGFSNDFELCVKCITNSIAEMEWLIANYQSDIFTVHTYPSISDSEAQLIKNTSYENLLPAIYALNPNLIVFNYGWNDGGETIEEAEALISLYGNDNLYCYVGAMNFLLRHIFSHNSHQAVTMIGEIRERPINEVEKYVADKWLIPFYDLYNKCGFSSEIIETTGYWDNNNIWIESGGVTQQIEIYRTWLQDGIHPHSSSDGRALARITKCLIPFFMNDLRNVVAD